MSNTTKVVLAGYAAFAAYVYWSRTRGITDSIQVNARPYVAAVFIAALWPVELFTAHD